MKHRIAMTALALLLVLLCACAPSEGQTEPTRLTAPPTVPPTTEGPMTEALTGIGTLCDIAEYDDGYLLLTHTGLYILDENFANRRSAGEEWEKLFATRDDEGFWERVWLNQDQKERLFKNLTVTPQGIFFCAVRPDSFMNGDWYWGHRERPAEESTASDGVHISAYFGMEYVASWGGSLYGISGYLLYRDG